jgi:hypothetical protein
MIPIHPYSIVVTGAQSTYKMQATRIPTVLTSYLRFAGLATVTWWIVRDIASFICKTQEPLAVRTLVERATCVPVAV